MVPALSSALSFLLPFAVFFLWLWLRARWMEGHGGQIPPIEKGHLFWLSLTGALLAIAVLIAMALADGRGGAAPGTPYVAPRVIDGKVVPGEFRP